MYKKPSVAPSNTKSLLCGNLRCCSSRSWAHMSRWDVRNRPHSVGGRELRLLLLWVGLCVCVCVCVCKPSLHSLCGCLGIAVLGREQWSNTENHAGPLKHLIKIKSWFPVQNALTWTLTCKSPFTLHQTLHINKPALVLELAAYGLVNIKCSFWLEH